MIQRRVVRLNEWLDGLSVIFVQLYKRWSTMVVLREALQDMRINDKPAVFNSTTS
jgi:hypothetical protein